MTDPDHGPADPGDTTDELRAALGGLRDLVERARAMPMSASCVINRADVLAMVEVAERSVPAPTQAGPTDQEIERILAEARAQAAALVARESIVTAARTEADRIVAEAQREAEGLRTETDTFVDQRMASFESVLHKTMSQVQLARARLSQRSGLDEGDDEAE